MPSKAPPERQDHSEADGAWKDEVEDDEHIDPTDSFFNIAACESRWLEKQLDHLSRVFCEFPAPSLEDRYMEFKYGVPPQRVILCVIMFLLSLGHLGILIVNDYWNANAWVGKFQAALVVGLNVCVAVNYFVCVRSVLSSRSSDEKRALLVESFKCSYASLVDSASQLSERRAWLRGIPSAASAGAAMQRLQQLASRPPNERSPRSPRGGPRGTLLSRRDSNHSLNSGDTVESTDETLEDVLAAWSHSTSVSRAFFLPRFSFEQTIFYERLGFVAMLLGHGIALIVEVHASLCLEREKDTPSRLRGCFFRIYPYTIIGFLLYPLLFRYRMRWLLAVASIVVVVRGMGRVIDRKAASDDTFWLSFSFEIVLAIVFSVVAGYLDRSDRSRFVMTLTSKAHTLTARRFQSRLDDALRAVLPHHVLHRMVLGEPVLDVAPMSVVSVCELVDFVSWSNMVLPEMSVHAINYIVNIFDDEVAAAGLQKIKAFGDRYVCSAPLYSAHQTVEGVQDEGDIAHSGGLTAVCSTSAEDSLQRSATISGMAGTGGLSNTSDFALRPFSPVSGGVGADSRSTSNTVEPGAAAHAQRSRMTKVTAALLVGNPSSSPPSIPIAPVRRTQSPRNANHPRGLDASQSFGASGPTIPAGSPSDDALRVFRLAGRQQLAIAQLNGMLQSTPLRAHIAVHTGLSFGAVVGTTSVSYDIFGPTVAIASNVVQQCPPGTVAATATVLELPRVAEALDVDTNNPLFAIEVPFSSLGLGVAARRRSSGGSLSGATAVGLPSPTSTSSATVAAKRGNSLVPTVSAASASGSGFTMLTVFAVRGTKRNESVMNVVAPRDIGGSDGVAVVSLTSASRDEHSASAAQRTSLSTSAMPQRVDHPAPHVAFAVPHPQSLPPSTSPSRRVSGVVIVVPGDARDGVAHQSGASAPHHGQPIRIAPQPDKTAAILRRRILRQRVQRARAAALGNVGPKGSRTRKSSDHDANVGSSRRISGAGSGLESRAGSGDEVDPTRRSIASNSGQRSDTDDSDDIIVRTKNSASGRFEAKNSVANVVKLRPQQPSARVVGFENNTGGNNRDPVITADGKVGDSAGENEYTDGDASELLNLPNFSTDTAPHADARESITSAAADAAALRSADDVEAEETAGLADMSWFRTEIVPQKWSLAFADPHIESLYSEYRVHRHRKFVIPSTGIFAAFTLMLLVWLIADYHRPKREEDVRYPGRRGDEFRPGSAVLLACVVVVAAVRLAFFKWLSVGEDSTALQRHQARAAQRELAAATSPTFAERKEKWRRAMRSSHAFYICEALLPGILMICVYVSAAMAHDSILNGDLAYLNTCFTALIGSSFLIYPFAVTLPIAICVNVVPCYLAIYAIQRQIFLSHFVSVPLLTLVTVYYAYTKERENRERFVALATGELQLQAARDDLALQHGLLELLFPAHVVSTVVERVADLRPSSNAIQAGAASSGSTSTNHVMSWRGRRRAMNSTYMQKFNDLVIVSIRLEDFVAKLAVHNTRPIEAFRVIDSVFLAVDAIIARATLLRKVHTMGDMVMIVGPLSELKSTPPDATESHIGRDGFGDAATLAAGAPSARAAVPRGHHDYDVAAESRVAATEEPRPSAASPTACDGGDMLLGETTANSLPTKDKLSDFDTETNGILQYIGHRAAMQQIMKQQLQGHQQQSSHGASSSPTGDCSSTGGGGGGGAAGFATSHSPLMSASAGPLSLMASAMASPVVGPADAYGASSISLTATDVPPMHNPLMRNTAAGNTTISTRTFRSNEERGVFVAALQALRVLEELRELSSAAAGVATAGRGLSPGSSSTQTTAAVPPGAGVFEAMAASATSIVSSTVTTAVEQLGVSQLSSSSRMRNAAVRVAAIAVVGSAFGAVVGLEQATFDVIGVAPRRCSALINAAPYGFIGVSESFRRSLLDGHCPYLPFGAMQQWRVRGVGSVAVLPLADGASATAGLPAAPHAGLRRPGSGSIASTGGGSVFLPPIMSPAVHGDASPIAAQLRTGISHDCDTSGDL